MSEVIEVVEDRDLKLPGRYSNNKHLNEKEVCCLLLPYVVENIKISNRELARLTGLDYRSIGKYRKSQTFTEMLIEHTNDKMLAVRFLAVEELEKLLNDKNLNQNTRVKVIHEILSHSERMCELLLMARKEVPKISVDDILRELEDF